MPETVPCGWPGGRGAKCLLASATPSIESYVNATGGKYGFVTLAERYGDGRLPRIAVSDSLRAFKQGERRLHFDKALLDRMAATLGSGRQVMLFPEPARICSVGGVYAVRLGGALPRCSVTLTYHKLGDRMKCHLCGLLLRTARRMSPVRDAGTRIDGIRYGEGGGGGRVALSDGPHPASRPGYGRIACALRKDSRRF